MSQQQLEVTSPTGAQNQNSLDSDQDQTGTRETVEDTVDSKSVRSLTKRTVSSSKTSSSDNDSHDGLPDNTANQKETKLETKLDSVDLSNNGGDEFEQIIENGIISPISEARTPLSKRFSHTSNLDNVSLDDEAPSKEEEEAAKAQEKAPSKTLSLNSLTSALPTMPWSPSNEAIAKGAGTTEPPSSATWSQPAPPPPPPPPTRKISSPFSWLSRSSSSKEKDPPPPQTSPRRNTASSIATLTSNPEMMLSKLEEEKEGETDGSSKALRNSLRDRFKLLRMREEAGITTLTGEDDQVELVNGTRSLVASPNLSEEPPVPAPVANLAPGTVSGVNAGPSALPPAEVDWDLWQSVVYEGPAAVARTSAEELNRAIATGIPSAIRGVIWQVLAQSKNDDLELAYKDLIVRGTEKAKSRNSNSTTTSATSNGNLGVSSPEAVASSASSIHSNYSAQNSPGSPPLDAAGKPQILSEAERKRKEKEDAAALQKLEKAIRRDLGTRTSFSKYAAASGLQEGLFGVCKAYALYDEGVGYAQGMNFLVMPLLFNMPEQEAFCLLVRLMTHYGLRDLFIQDMPGLHMRLFQFERLLEDFEPALYCHLRRRGITSHLYATQWFLTLFAYRFPLQLVLRIYDLIFSEGLSAILRFGLVLMQKNATTLLGLSDMGQLTGYLKDKLFDVYIDKDPSHGSLLENGFFGSSSSSMDKEVYRADQLVTDACEIKITPEILKAYTVEWEEKTRAEKERETELHDLRVGNQQYASKLRKLEERVEACDTEQAALATELVHTKVENQELKDENESLRGQVRELRIVIEKQPIEIEETWNLERDDLMKRNQKVHEENQELEKSLQELEEQLVATKLQYAELNSQHEALSRKWADLKRQFV
ncbi:unnamed protein product [Clonostachys byssicola]|uniref:GTPase-activating protein GYP5 n=1 Tax=Clonostachys byssicola TaxID=160290 RepID=A0A9N9UXM5_9HYPO|nr:unnamed protein product [Clonostachys byssicola]